MHVGVASRQLCIRVSRLPLVLLAAAAAAGCVDSPLGVEPRRPTLAVQLTCVAVFLESADDTTAPAASVECTPASAPARGTRAAARGVAPADVILGNQGVNVLITFSGASYNVLFSAFTVSVTVKNLLGQPLGTTDGITPAANGTRVFFISGPSVKTGFGLVTVTADGTGTFTAAGQQYFQYAGIIQPAATSAARQWQFVVPFTVSAFSFTIAVDAITPP